jgi:hypothetical protein
MTFEELSDAEACYRARAHAYYCKSKLRKAKQSIAQKAEAPNSERRQAEAEGDEATA